jgi:hypothetical protein
MAQEHGMINPFNDRQVREGVISYGVSSYGYDLRVADEFHGVLTLTAKLSQIIELISIAIAFICLGACARFFSQDRKKGVKLLAVGFCFYIAGNILRLISDWLAYGLDDFRTVFGGVCVTGLIVFAVFLWKMRSN